jgi:electron transfer flavoprotein alpha subunit
VSRLLRDPRAERGLSVVSPSGRLRFSPAPVAARPRRDPRAERAAAEIPAARRRFDWTEKRVAPLAPAAAAEAPAPALRVVAEPAFLVFAVVDAPRGHLSAQDRQILAAAHILAAPGGGAAALVGPDATGAAEAGADRLVRLESDTDPDVRAGRLIALITYFKPRHVLWAESEVGGDLARRVAVRLGEPLFTQAEGIKAREVRRPEQGRRVERRARPPRLIAFREGAVAPYAGLRCEARPMDAPAPAAGASAWLSVEDVAPDAEATPLGEAGFVAAAGNGVTDFDGFRALARALGATPGASRMVCDAGLMPRAAQVGASGTVLAARCYFALGIAGAPQHLQGVANCETVVAVNTDLHAAMIARAALAVVADAQKVIPALRALLGERR